MQKLPVYLYPNLIVLQLDLDNEVRRTNNTMYQRELKIQKGLKNKVQLQFKNSDQKAVRIKALGTLASPASTSSNDIIVDSNRGIQVGMLAIADNITTGTYVSAINSTTITLSLLDPAYDPYTDSFVNPITSTITSGTNITFKHNFVFSMFDASQQRMIVQKTLEIVDDGVTTSSRGLALLELTESDTRNLDTSYYTFGVTLTDSDGANLPAYSDTYYGMNGTVKLTHDLWPTLKDNQTVTTFQVFANTTDSRYEFLSGNLRAYPENSETTTVAMYLENFTGTILVQGTLEDAPGYFANYATIDTKTYEGYTGVVYSNAVGRWSDVRVKWYPDNSDLPGLLNYYSPEMPGNPTPGTAYYPNGKIDKVLYRS
jgi:hypothetical protein